MNNRNLLINEMKGDLRRSPIVLYLEGKTDVPIFFGMLGVPLPTGSPDFGYLHDDCLVRGLGRKGSGSSSVRARVELADSLPEMKGHFFGILDGDGGLLTELLGRFVPPYPGPLFQWPAYCIENMLVKSGWPSSWGTAPAWEQVVPQYAPYVSLTLLWKELMQVLSDLELHGFAMPDHSRPLKTSQDILDVLGRGRDRLLGYDVVRRFQEECASFVATSECSMEEAHTLLNGKWLASRVAVERRMSVEDCTSEWAQALAAQGGYAPVRDFWQRVVRRTR